MALDFGAVDLENRQSETYANGAQTSSSLIDLSPVSSPVLAPVAPRVPSNPSSNGNTDAKHVDQRGDQSQTPTEDPLVHVESLIDEASLDDNQGRSPKEPPGFHGSTSENQSNKGQSNKNQSHDDQSHENQSNELLAVERPRTTDDNWDVESIRQAHFDKRSKETPNFNPFTLVAEFSDPLTLLHLAAVSKQARAAATSDLIWKPICSELGFPNKTADDSSLLSLVSAANVIERGYLPGEMSPYKTFVHAGKILRPVLLSPNGFDDLDCRTKASTLGNVWRFAKLTGNINDDASRTFKDVVSKAKDELMEELRTAIRENRSIEAVHIEAVDIWTHKTGDEDLKRKIVDLFLSHNMQALAVDDSFIYSANGDDDAQQQVSQQKVENSFRKITSSLIQIMTSIKDAQSPFPQSWRSFMWSQAISKAMAIIITYVQELLRVTTKDISELEYLCAVPRIYLASRVLTDNSILKENAESTDFDVETYVDLTIMKPILEEFCERQATYVENYARQKVEGWNESVSQRETETEQLLWSSVPKRSDKNKFISSFKWAFLSADTEEDDRVASRAANASNTSSSSAAAGTAALDPMSRSVIPDNNAPATEFEAQTAVLVSKLRGMESLVSIEMAIDVLEVCKAAVSRLKTVNRADAKTCEPLFCTYLRIIGRDHIQTSFEKAIKVLNSYDPKKYGRLLISIDTDRTDESTDELYTPFNTDAGDGSSQGTDVLGTDFSKPAKPENANKANAVEPLAVFTEMMNIGDLVQQMVHVFFEEELVGAHIVKRGDFAASSVNAKRRFEQMLDDMLAEGMSRGIDVLMEQVEFTLMTEQLGSDYLPLPTQVPMAGPTPAALKVVDLVRSHLDLLRESTEKGLFDVFQQEVGARLYAAVSKHLRRQIISIDGAINVVADMNVYYAFIVTLRQKNLLPYYETLKQVSQLYLIEPRYAKQIGLAISDSARYNGLMSTEDLVELVKRRQDWPEIKPKVEKVLYGLFECIIC